MKKIYGLNCILGFTAGIVVYILALLVSEMGYFNITDGLFTTMLYFLIFFGSAFAIIILLIKKPSVLSMLIRFFCLLISYSLFFVLIGISGLIPFVERLLNISPESGADNVSGLMFITFSAVVLLVSVITIIIRTVINCLQSFKKKAKNNSTNI